MESSLSDSSGMVGSPAHENAMAQRVGAYWPWMLAIVALVRGSLRLSLSPERMLSRFVADDGLYYLAVARNAASGHGVSFDGQTPTNGFHPLWQLITTVLASVVGGDAALIHATILIGTILGALTLVLFDSSLRLLGVALPWRIVVGLWLVLNPFCVDFWSSGVESPIWGLCLMSLVRLSLSEAGIAPVWLGVWAGLVMLARTDSVLLVLPALWSVWNRRRGLRPLLEFFVGGAATVLPWFLFSAVVLGGIVQSSGLAVPWYTHELFRLQHPGSGLLTLLVRSFYVMGRYALYIAVKLTAIRTVTTVLAIFLLARALFTSSATPKVKLLGGYLFAAFATIALNGFARWVARDWYFYPLLLLTGLSMGWALQWASERWPGRPLVPVALSLLMFADPFYWKYQTLERYPEQATMYRAAEWAAHDLPSSAQLAAFNAGIIGYFNHQRVINLDGVVNADAFAALRSKSLADYLKARKVTQLIDIDHTVDDYALFFGRSPAAFLQERRRFHGEQGSDVVVWDVVLDDKGAGRD